MKQQNRNMYGYIRWKKKDTWGMIIILFAGLILTSFSIMGVKIYDAFFSLCLGFFIGGILMTVISLFLAQMESSILGEGEIDVDAEIDIDVDVDADIDIDAEVDVDAEIDIDSDVDIDSDIDSDVDIDSEIESEVDANMSSDITPAPIMLLLSTALLFFGILGIILYYTIPITYRFLIFFITPIITYLITKMVNFSWKKIAKSRYYIIASTQNLIGREGEVILTVDKISGLIKITSDTPMRFEKVPVKPFHEDSVFKRGQKVYICTARQGVLLVDDNPKNIQKRVEKARL